VLLLQARKYLIAHSTGTVTIPRTMTGRQKKQGNQFPHSKNLVQEPEGNEENRYSDPDLNKKKINYAKEPNEAHKNNVKEETFQVINENFTDIILNMVNQNVQETLKQFQDNKNREFEKAQEEIKETIEALYKHQSETKNTINKEINELRAKIDNIKEEGTPDMKNLRKNRNAEQNGRPIQQNRTNRRQNLRTRR
jgi:gas vesicle protein